jgi:2-keto-3-deoxy-L-rhamnonate aldolase RhmA
VARAHGYGLQFAEYVTRANDRISVIVQIEHVAAVRALDEILQVEGIDGILIGPYDLSGSMNRLGDVKHPAVQATISTIRDKCVQAAMPVGIFMLNPDDVAAELAKGPSFLAVGTDLSFMLNTGNWVLAEVRKRTHLSTTSQ